MNILILVNWYPPDLRVPARRWGNLVSELKESGHNCTIISAGNGKPDTYVGTAGEKVIRVSISNRENVKGKSELAVKSNMSCKKRLKDFLLKTIPSSCLRSPYDYWKTTLQNTPGAIEIAQQSDCIVSSYGPIGPFMAGRWLAKETNKPWVADIRDAFESKGTGKFWVAKKVDRAYERILLKRACLRITVGETLANYLSKQYRQEFIAIYNGWSGLDKLLASKKESLYFYYAGTIYQHRLSALNVLIKSLHYFPQLQLKIRLLKDSTGGELNDFLKNTNQSGQVVILPPAPPEIIDEELMQSSGAIVIENIDPSDELRNGTVTGKLLSLLVSGLPGIAVVSKECEITRLVQKANGWYSVENIKDCVSAIKNVLNQKDLINNAEALREYSMDQQAAKLILSLSRT